MKAEDLATYELLEKQEISIGDFVTMGKVLRHKKTGAKVALLENNDENKVFYIGFRTPPKDSTGVAHILEHSVLCGSEKFPLKDPFIELAKGSLNTFLNAMTYPDKTVYPVASCNDKDFQNLMDVYLDAVFHPNIYNNSAIFRQEGWHYEFDDDGKLIYNGVVYNEMKGAFSNADEIFSREIMNHLYPDTAYGVESGGDPEVIPELTYENFLAFHSKYYHPSNSYIYLYGNMDMAEKLDFIDKEYLSAYDALEVDSEIKPQPTFEKPEKMQLEYPVDEGENLEEKAYLSVNYSVGDTLDPELYVAFQVLDRVICNINGAPLKAALLDAGLGKDVYSIYDNGILQPTFSIIAKDTAASREEEFLNIVKDTLQKIVKDGFDRKALESSLNHYEFKYLEADFGHFPKGLLYGLQALDSWLYDERKPFIHIDANNTFASLRSKIDTGYFESLVEKYLLQNPHSLVLTMTPKCGLLEEKEEQLAKKLEALQASLSKEELADIQQKYDLLRAFQDAEDTPENLEKLPMLEREDLGRKAAAIVNEERKIGDVPFLYHDIFSNGIGYLKLIFRVDQVPEEYFPYIGLLKTCLFDLSTEHYTYGDLVNEIALVAGGMNSSVNVVSKLANPDQCHLSLQMGTKFMYRNLEKAIDIIEDVMLTTKYDDTKRLLEILREYKANTQQSMISAGHSLALSRAMAYENYPAAYMDILSGLTQYRFCSELEENFESVKESIAKKLTDLAKMVFRPENLEVDFVGAKEVLPALESKVKDLQSKLFTDNVVKKSFVPVLEKKNEGLTSPSQVQYVCRAGNYRKKGLPYVGSLKVLKVMMGYDYLWMNVRVKGGAYGCMCGFSTTGESYFVSYRDPNLKKTVEVYEKAAEYIEGFTCDERTMTKYIIGAIGELDTPMMPSAYGNYSRNAFLSGETMEDIQRERDELLATTDQEIRNLGKYIRAFMEDECFTVTGNTGKIKEEEKMFSVIENLF